MKRQKETTIASNDVTKSMHQVTSPKVAPGDARETPCDGHATSGRHLLNGSLGVDGRHPWDVLRMALECASDKWRAVSRLGGCPPVCACMCAVVSLFSNMQANKTRSRRRQCSKRTKEEKEKETGSQIIHCPWPQIQLGRG